VRPLRPEGRKNLRQDADLSQKHGKTLTPKSISAKLTKNFLSSSQIHVCPLLLGANLDL